MSRSSISEVAELLVLFFTSRKWSWFCRWNRFF